VKLFFLITADRITRKISEKPVEWFDTLFFRIVSEITVSFHIHHTEHIKNLHVKYSATQTIKIGI
jgi:hypothetical protein